MLCVIFLLNFNCCLFIFPGAIEKQKLVYIMNRDSSARLTISSPLEAHKSHTLVFSVVGVDVGFENPMFACLEIDYEVSFLKLPIALKPYCNFTLIFLRILRLCQTMFCLVF